MSSGSNDERKPAGPPSAAEPDKPASEGRVIRDAEGVIVGARSAGPKILGMIDLKGRTGTPARRPGARDGSRDSSSRDGGPRAGGSRDGGSSRTGGDKPSNKPSSSATPEIVLEPAGDQPKGRASARKAREERSSRRVPERRAVRRGKPSSAGTAQMSEDKKRVRIDEVISVGELAKQMGVKAPKVIRVIWGMGIRNATINTTIDVETAELVAADFGYRVEDVSFDESELIDDGDDEVEQGELRAPVIAVMGHVDHGKTTLLDRLRGAAVAAGEAGGITQHVGAYRVHTSAGPMVFVDTPGHSAFSAMRERGANLTDIALLVVAANDGVMPTTIEALRQVQAAEVPILVAVNKCDLPDADVAKVERQLMEHGVLSETYGGETPVVRIAAKHGMGLDDLIDQLAVLAELLELRATTDGRATGIVVESRVDRGRGVIATVLVQSGTLARGDVIVAGESTGRVSALTPMGETDEPDDAMFRPHPRPEPGPSRGEAMPEQDDAKKKPKQKRPKKGSKAKPAPATVQSSGPSTVVEVSGLDEPPAVGIPFNVVEDDKSAKQLVAHRREQRRRREGARSSPPTVAERLAAERRAELPNIALIVRADVQGSLEAVEQIIAECQSHKIQTRIISAGVGEITEGDIKLATTARQAGNNVVPAILGFGVKAGAKVNSLAESEQIPVRCAKIIYELADLLRSLMLSLLEPTYVEHPQGRAEIRKLFPTSAGQVCGCRVVDGKIARSAGIRVLRGGEVITTTKLASLRIVNRDVKEVGTDQECGILLAEQGDVREGDVLLAFELEAIPATL
jgi:translation initiation factor IF-2